MFVKRKIKSALRSRTNKTHKVKTLERSISTTLYQEGRSNFYLKQEPMTENNSIVRSKTSVTDYKRDATLKVTEGKRAFPQDDKRGMRENTGNDNVALRRCVSEKDVSTYLREKAVIRRAIRRSSEYNTVVVESDRVSRLRSTMIYSPIIDAPTEPATEFLGIIRKSRSLEASRESIRGDLSSISRADDELEYASSLATSNSQHLDFGVSPGRFEGFINTNNTTTTESDIELVFCEPLEQEPTFYNHVSLVRTSEETCAAIDPLMMIRYRTDTRWLSDRNSPQKLRQNGHDSDHSATQSQSLEPSEFCWPQVQLCSEKKIMLLTGCHLFNRNPAEGLKYLISHGILQRDVNQLAKFLIEQPLINRQSIGEYFGLISDDQSTQVLKCFLQLIDLKDKEVDEALRIMLSYFHPSGESQKISHLMECFQEAYVSQNPAHIKSHFRSASTVEILAYSVLMLQTDLHNPCLRIAGKRMTEDQFVSNNRGIDDGSNLPESMLRGIYHRVASKQFRALPDCSDQLRQLETILVGLSESLVQRERRFLGWAIGHQLNKITPKHRQQRKHWRYVLVFNDLLIIAKQMSNQLSGSLWNVASATVLSKSNSISLANLRSGLTKMQYYGVQPMSSGTYQIMLEIPITECSILIFDTRTIRYGIRLYRDGTPVANFGLSSANARQCLLEWFYEANAEIRRLEAYRTAQHFSSVEELATTL